MRASKSRCRQRRPGRHHGDHLLHDARRRSARAYQRLAFAQSERWQRDLWHFLFRARIRGFVDAVLAQDIVALGTMPPWPAQEHLYGHDAGLTRARKHFREAAKAQARELLLEPVS